MVTIKDVAKLANVSITTVSRVINNPQAVSEDKRINVEKIIEELNYQPNGLARGLVKKATKTVGVLIPDINNLFYPAVVRGIEDVFQEEGFNTFLCNTDQDIEKEKRYIAALMEKRVDGLIFMGTRPTDPAANEHIKSLCKSIPVVLINETIVGADLYSVLTDEIEGAYKAVSYLIELGHKKIVYIAGDNIYSTYQSKQKGYESALKDHGYQVLEDYIINGSPYPQGGYQAANKILQWKERPTAIFCGNDQIAMGVMKAVHEMNLKIPEDISVIGFANIPISEDFMPELTTVDQYPYETGKLSAEVILNVMKGNLPVQKKIILEPSLLIRNSCAGI